MRAPAPLLPPERADPLRHWDQTVELLDVLPLFVHD
jgi:hypothetical protein